MSGADDELERTDVRHLSERALARRWDKSPRTLQRWRALKEGPAFIKIGGSIRYRLVDVINYEIAQRSAEHDA